jgi:hypothetical protein
MTTIYFCKDGVLRLHSSNEKIMISMNFIQNHEQLSDLAFWAKWWHSPVLFEKGLSIFNFLECLQPWCDFWSEYTQKDIQAYIKESKRPILVQNETLDWVSLDYRIEIKPEINYPEELLEESPNATVHLKSQWQIYGYYELAGYKYDNEKHFLIEHLPMNELSNLELVLNPRQIGMIDEFYINRYGKVSQHLLNRHGLGVNQIYQAEDNEAQFSYISGFKNHTFRDVVDGFFSQFNINPNKRDEFNASISQAIEKTLEEFHNSNSDGNEESISFSHSQSTATFFSEPNNPYSQEDYYNELVRQARKNESSQIRIGKIEAGQCHEIRLLSWIISETNK